MAALKPDLITVQAFKVHDQEVICQLDKHHDPSISYSGQSYHSILQLIKALPALNQPENLKSLARAVNFLCSTIEYQFIEDITKFKEEYVNRVEFEQNSFDYIPDRVVDHGVFDITVMHPPKIVDHELVFYVKNENNQLPYRVSCIYPIENDSPDMRYQLLPYSSS